MSPVSYAAGPAALQSPPGLLRQPAPVPLPTPAGGNVPPLTDLQKKIVAEFKSKMSALPPPATYTTNHLPWLFLHRGSSRCRSGGMMLAADGLVLDPESDQVTEIGWVAGSFRIGIGVSENGCDGGGFRANAACMCGSCQQRITTTQSIFQFAHIWSTDRHQDLMALLRRLADGGRKGTLHAATGPQGCEGPLTLQTAATDCKGP